MAVLPLLDANVLAPAAVALRFFCVGPAAAATAAAAVTGAVIAAAAATEGVTTHPGTDAVAPLATGQETGQQHMQGVAGIWVQEHAWGSARCWDRDCL